MSATITLYAVETDTSNSFGLAADHAYVLSSEQNTWNCFGRSDGGRVVRSGVASAKWAKLIYGPNCEGGGNDKPAAGIRVRYDGVCQTAANRILVLVGRDFDARETKGNVLATLAFGKFGFNVADYIAAVTSTGQQLIKTNPGEISAADIQTVLNRITYGQTADAELDILHVDMKEQLSISLPDITDAQRAIARPIYSDYQKKRNDAFINTPKQPGEEIAKTKLFPNLIRPWKECVEKLIAALGVDQFKEMFGVTPNDAKGKIPGL